MKRKCKKQISILLCLFLTCTNLFVGNVNMVYAQGEGEDTAASQAAAPYDEVYVIDDANTKETEYEGNEYCQIEYSDGWTGEGKDNGGAGCYNDTDHWTNTPGATCKVTFKGTNLKFYSRTGPRRDFGAADFSVDGKEAVNVSFQSDAQTNHVFLYDTGILPYGEHVLTITAKGLIVVDRVEVSCPYTMVNDADEGADAFQLIYGGTWHYEGSTQPGNCTHAFTSKVKESSYEKDVHWAEKAGDSLELKFNGTSVKYYTESGSAQVKVSIDGEPIAENLSMNTGTPNQGLSFNSRDYKEFNAGLHTLKVELVSGVLVSDRIEVSCSHKNEEQIIVNEKAALCEEEGYSGDTCYKDCGQKISEGQAVPAKGHTWDAGIVTIEPTEEKDGEKTYTCTDCNKTRTETVSFSCSHENKQERHKEATCTEAGYRDAYYCLDCQKMISEGTIVEALGHDRELRDQKEASGTEDGYTGDTYCKRCKELLESGEVIPKAYAVVNDAITGSGELEFNYIGKWGIGTGTENCYEGDNHWSDTTDAALEFKFSGTSVKYLSQKGNNLGYAAFSIDGGEEEKINMYQANKQDQVLIYQSLDLQPGLHTLKVRVTGENGAGPGTNVVVADRIEVYCNHKGEETESRDVPATCTQAAHKGEIYGKLCGQRISAGVDEGEPLGHIEKIRGDKEATCTEAGNTGETYCERCEEIVNPGEEVAALGHQWDEGTVTTEPTEDTEGIKTFTCTRTGCGVTMTVPLPATGGDDCHHVHTEARNQAATCTEAGYTGAVYCKDCQKIIYKGEVEEPLGHEESIRGKKDADCTKAGHTGETYCARCNEVLDSGREIPALGHQWDKGVVTKQPTVTKTGEKTFTCAICKITERRVLPKKQAPVPKAPKKGSKLKDTSSKAEYKVLSAKISKGKVTGTVSYVKPQNKSAKTVTIPAKITVNGGVYTVTAVADKAFYNNKKITKVIIGNNVTKIGAKAFYNCKKLKTATIGKKVETIGNSAFGKCTALTKIMVPAKVKKIGRQSFYGCKKLKTITVKTAKLTKSSVGSNAFKGISAKATIKVPKSKLKSYKSIMRARGASRKVKIKKV